MSQIILLLGIAMYYCARLLGERYSHPGIRLLLYASVIVMAVGGIIYELQGLACFHSCTTNTLAWATALASVYYLSTRFLNSIATVTGPMPPGTGV